MLAVRVALFGMLLAAVLLPLVYALLRVRRTKSASGPRCASCRYIVRGLESKTCPECGSKLYPDGIVYPKVRRPLGAGGRRLVWAVFMLWFAWFLTTGPGKHLPDQFLAPAIPIKGIESDYFELQDFAGGTPSVRVAVVARGIEPNLTPRELIVGKWSQTFWLDPTVGGLHVDLGTLACEARDDRGMVTQARRPLDADAAAKWLAAQGWSEKDAGAMAAALVKVPAMVRTYPQLTGLAMRRGLTPVGTMRISGGASSHDRQPVVSAQLLTWATLLALWLIGVLILRVVKEEGIERTQRLVTGSAA